MSRYPLHDILFLDIETVSSFRRMDEMDERLQKEWTRKSNYHQRLEEKSAEELYPERAGIYAEFGKIIVIGLGFFTKSPDGLIFRLKALSGENEKELLQNFRNILLRFDSEKLQLCAHNGKEFDFPYLSRRMLINGIALPDVLKLAGKKPWEVQHLDTMEMWKFGDYKHYTSLDLLAALFEIDTSKSELDGSKVGKAYYEEGDLESITRYCLNDVEVVARVYLHLTEQHDLTFDVVYAD
ncbi:3'-5' exonuclease [Fulvivirga sedimenti]|uniref:3'-5' exonuclease n=1 Tax=Fulvivirga sedimenti TaxID=2879465 RepID=A0A9X1HV36_9BACT|nr:3'-5' exonuclease [Fulvivirga sedimenti]MCA6078465.1 3'-5' exonuclease [Fulvivirga sedimenti]